ncbi:MAG: hypothetical protein V2J24_09320 [Pseudomonadales bacterium]|jgi:uridine kinase|nr:hypothetical protein [Pseudomonadales bacterium]
MDAPTSRSEAPKAPTRLELPSELPELAARIHDREAASGHPIVVAIAGGTSTGKSTFVAEPLRVALGGDARLVAQDMQQRRSPAAMDPRWAWDDPANYGIEACVEAIERFRRRQAFAWPRYHFATRTHGEPESIKPGRILLLEGLYAACGSLREAVDIVVYVEARAIVRLVRRMLRNEHERYPGLAVAGSTGGRFLGTVLAAHRACVRPQREDADFVVQTAPEFAHLQSRFRLEALPIQEAADPRRRVAFDAETTVSTVELEDGRLRLRIHWRDRCVLDTPFEPEAADAFDGFDPDET